MLSSVVLPGAGQPVVQCALAAEACLQPVVLSSAVLSSAVLSSAVLSSAVLSSAVLSSAVLSSAVLSMSAVSSSALSSSALCCRLWCCQALASRSSNVRSLLKRVYSLAGHPCPFKRLGAALAFNNIYTIFR